MTDLWNEGLSLSKPYPPVRSKWDFVNRYKKGEFGNAAPTWGTLPEYEAADYRGLVHVRNKIPAGKTWYNLNHDQVKEAWAEALSLGLNHTDLYISAMAPEHRKIFQGEVIEGATGMRLYYNQQPLPMREGFEVEQKWAGGEQARRLIEHFFCPKSYDWLKVLFDRYPGHTIEFSTYEVEWGTLPGYNTVFWEVRSY